MSLSPLLLADFEPTCVVELGRARADDAPAELEDLRGARNVRLSDRGELVRDPRALAAALDSAAPFDVVIDHASDDPAITVALFELIFGRLSAEGLYVIDGSVEPDLLLDLMLGSVGSPSLVDCVGYAPPLVVVRRGREGPSRHPVALGDLRSDPYGVVSR
jgi:hypothetical protein